MEEFETTNINLEWLNNIYNQLKLIQDIERISREGCRNLMEYLEIPISSQRIIMADTQYKNMRFFALELDILITNLSPVIKDKIDKYDSQLKTILNNVDNRNLFIEEITVNNKLAEVHTLPFFNSTISLLVSIKSQIIQDISHILYLPIDDENKKRW